MGNAFAETRNLFTIATHYVKPLSFEEWAKIPRPQMSAVLFVQYYEEITLAWYKVKSFYAVDEDGVSTVCQYLEKNVNVILDKPERFTSSYIYKVAYNCLYCICHDIKRDRERWENETSNIVTSGEDELDLFDTFKSESAEDKYAVEDFQKKFWDLIEEGGPEMQKVADYLINNDPSALKKKRKPLPGELLSDIEVSVEKLGEIIENLKVRLAEFKDYI